MIAPNDVSVVVCGRDLDESVPEFSAPDVLFGLIAADVALEHDVAVIGRADDLPPVLGQKIKESRDLRQALRRIGDVFAEPA